MNTISTISNISFNTPEFFRLKIESLVKAGVLDWAHWILHEPDTDQRKAHIHFVCKPSKRIDTNALRKEFQEPITAAYIQSLENPTIDDCKPLGCLPFEKTSSMTDWLLYAIHDEKYLFRKGQSRNIHYPREAVQSTDPDFLAQQWEDTADPLDALTARVIQLLTVENYTFSQILSTGIIPPNLVYYYKELARDFVSPYDGVVRKTPWSC